MDHSTDARPETEGDRLARLEARAARLEQQCEWIGEWIERSRLAIMSMSAVLAEAHGVVLGGQGADEAKL